MLTKYLLMLAGALLFPNVLERENAASRRNQHYRKKIVIVKHY